MRVGGGGGCAWGGWGWWADRQWPRWVGYPPGAEPPADSARSASGFRSGKMYIFIFLRFGDRLPLFLFIFHIFITYIHSFNHIQYIYPSPFAVVFFHILIACKLRGKNLPGVPSWESNSGLPYSMPTRYQLRYAAPFWLRLTLDELC